MKRGTTLSSLLRCAYVNPSRRRPDTTICVLVKPAISTCGCVLPVVAGLPISKEPFRPTTVNTHRACLTPNMRPQLINSSSGALPLPRSSRPSQPPPPFRSGPRWRIAGLPSTHFTKQAGGSSVENYVLMLTSNHSWRWPKRHALCLVLAAVRRGHDSAPNRPCHPVCSDILGWPGAKLRTAHPEMESRGASRNLNADQLINVTSC